MAFCPPPQPAARDTRDKTRQQREQLGSGTGFAALDESKSGAFSTRPEERRGAGPDAEIRPGGQGVWRNHVECAVFHRHTAGVAIAASEDQRAAGA